MGKEPISNILHSSTCNAGDPSSIPGSRRSAGEGVGYPLQYSWASLVAQLVKNPLAMRETWVPSLGREYPLEKGRLLTPVSWPGEFHGLYSPWGREESDTTEQLSLYIDRVKERGTIKLMEDKPLNSNITEILWLSIISIDIKII